MVDLGDLPSCAMLTSDHAEQAASSVEEMKRLLARVAEIARPEEGCPKVLMAVARLAGKDWVEGDLRVELRGDEAATTLSIFCDHGFGITERLVPSVRLEVPLDEFSRALELAPRLVLPLHVVQGDGKIVLVPFEREARGSTAPLSSIEIEPAAMPHEKTTAPPPEDELIPVDTGDGADAGAPPPSARPMTVHTRPTVRRMVAIDPAMFGRRDPRREDDD